MVRPFTEIVVTLVAVAGGVSVVKSCATAVKISGVDVGVVAYKIVGVTAGM